MLLKCLSRMFYSNNARCMSSKSSVRRADKLLDQLYNEIRAQRFSEIVLIQTKFDANPRYYILANAFNSRHLLNGTEMLNKQYKIDMKMEEEEFANVSISKEWNVLDFHAVVVHLFLHECREHFDIEQLWAVGEKYDDKSQQDIRGFRSPAKSYKIQGD